MRLIPLRAVAAVAAAALAGGLYLVATTGATNPGGSSCDPVGGQINGRGATFQTNAQLAFSQGYTNDVCGPAVGQMVQYNYAAAVGAGATGSGNGQKAASCRTDAYAGTDIPYDEATLALLNGTPGATGGCAITFTPPNPPNSGTYPDPSDAQAQIMSFPVAVGANGLGFDLTKAACGGTTPGTPQLTGTMVSLLLGGEIANWNDARLRTGGLNGFLSKCNVSVTRVVRMDKSGTTQITKNYLAKVDPNRTGAVCDPGDPWTTLAQDAHNQDWPTGAGCSTLTRPATSGGPAVVSLCTVTVGSFCYADEADIVAGAAKTATVRNGANSSFQTPLATNPATGLKTQANCDASPATLPGAGLGTASARQDASVGLNAGDNWGIDNPSGNHGDITDLGKKYPICGVTFDLVYKGLSAGSGSAINALSLNQRQTLYAYMTYILSSTGQAQLPQHFYASLPSGWVTTLLPGFQRNY
jgi:ABC-type phosphate transport system substrate-binding protein